MPVVLSDDDTSSYKKINLQDLRPAEWRIIRSAIVAFSVFEDLVPEGYALGEGARTFHCQRSARSVFPEFGSVSNACLNF